MEHIVLISKDILSCCYLPVYGNKHYKTPNIDELAQKGTVFNRHYTAAPSTAMAFTSMFSGLYPYETERTHYVCLENQDIEEKKLMFYKLEQKGYNCHQVWSESYIRMADSYSRILAKNTVRHQLISIEQQINQKTSQTIKRDEDLLQIAYNKLVTEIDLIDRSVPVFLWVHLPHVINGRTGYGDDIDVLDMFVGDIRKRFGDNITITADHGCSDGRKGTSTYGFYLDEPSIRIPLITSRIGDIETINHITSNTQLYDIIVNKIVEKPKFVISDTAYYKQMHRKIALIYDRHKYIYNREGKQEELYDIIEDPNENLNLLTDKVYNKRRKITYIQKQILYYPFWNDIPQVYETAKSDFQKIWKEGVLQENTQKAKFIRAIKSPKRMIRITRKMLIKVLSKGL